MTTLAKQFNHLDQVFLTFSKDVFKTYKANQDREHRMLCFILNNTLEKAEQHFKSIGYSDHVTMEIDLIFNGKSGYYLNVIIDNSKIEFNDAEIVDITKQSKVKGKSKKGQILSNLKSAINALTDAMDIEQAEYDNYRQSDYDPSY